MEGIWPNNSLCLQIIGHQLLYYIVLSIVLYINSRVFKILDRAKMRVRTFILPLSKGTYLHFTPIKGNVPSFYSYPSVCNFILPLSKGMYSYLHFWREVQQCVSIWPIAKPTLRNSSLLEFLPISKLKGLRMLKSTQLKNKVIPDVAFLLCFTKFSRNQLKK